MSLREEVTKVSHVFLFGQKEEELQNAKKSVEELTEEIKAERKNTQDLEAKYVKELQDAKDKYEKRIRELESELAAIDQELHFKHFLRAAGLLGVGALVIGLCMRSTYQFRQSLVRAKFRECRRRNKQLANDNQRQKEQISSQQFQIQFCHSTIVDTLPKTSKNKLKDSQLALRRSEEDKAQLTKDHFQLKETYTRLKESNTELKESNTRLEESKFPLKEANTRLEESNIELTEANTRLEVEKVNSTISSFERIIAHWSFYIFYRLCLLCYLGRRQNLAIQCLVAPFGILILDMKPETSQKLDNHNVNVCCKACSLPVAKLGSCTGGSRHVNPQGAWFEIGEFSKASGVGAADEAHAEHSWFHGYLWRFVATVIVNWAGNMKLQRLVAPFWV